MLTPDFAAKEDGSQSVSGRLLDGEEGQTFS
jgi:hypothetical protein